MRQITFKNKCSIPSWMPEDKKKFRESANKFISAALSQVPLLNDLSLEVSYFLQGVGSVVAKVVTPNGDAYVLKTTESANHTNAEICTYKAAANVGIKVPKIFYDDTHDDLPFFLMEFFSEPTLSETLRNQQMSLEEISAIRINFFNTLKKIEGVGYCWPTRYENGILFGNFQSIDDFMTSWFCKKDLLEIVKDRFPNFDWKIELDRRVENVKNFNNTDNCQLGTFDFQLDHIFSSTPPTLFDPCLKLEPKYFDLAHLIIPSPDSNSQNKKLNQDIFTGYQEAFGPINFDNLSDAVWLQSYRKAANQIKHNDDKRLRNGLFILETISDQASLEAHLKHYLL